MAALYVFFFSSMLKTKLKIFGHLLCLLCMNGNTFCMYVWAMWFVCIEPSFIAVFSERHAIHKMLVFLCLYCCRRFYFYFFIYFLFISFFFPTKFICYARVLIFFVGICVCCLYFGFQCAQTFIKVTLICYAI